MAVGHITLDGVEYALRGQNDIIRTNSNQMAAKTQGGGGDYDDLQNWAGWLMDSWEAGVGKKDPESSGFLYGTAETRFKGQLALASWARNYLPGADMLAPTTDGWSENLDQILGTISSPIAYRTIEVGADVTIKKLANSFRMNTDPEPINRFDILLPGKGNGCSEVVVELWYDAQEYGVDPGEEPLGPDTLITSVSVTLREQPGWYWYHVTGLETDGGAFTDPTWYNLVIYPAAGTLEVPTIVYPMNFSWWYFTGAETLPSEGWSQDDPDEPTQHISSFMNYWYNVESFGTASPAPIVHLEGYDHYAVDEWVFITDGAGGGANTGALGANVTDLMALDGRVYIALGDGANYAWLDDTGSGTETVESYPANKWLLFNGYLWRSVGSTLYYTSDEIEWFEVRVGFSREQITNMCGLLDGTLFVTTNRSCYIVNDGDVVQWISNFGNPKPENGKYMINFQGQVYFSTGETVIRFDGENMLPIGPDLEEGLPTFHAGQIVGMAANNNWMVVAVGGETGSLWAWNGQGWHFISELPVGLTIDGLGYSHEDANGFAYFTVSAESVQLFYVPVADTRKTQRRAAQIANSDYLYHFFSGWIETDWFYGGLREVDKDFESVFIDGENIDTDKHIDVYWQENEGDDWQYLGTVDESTEELRWSDYSTRPAGRRIRIGLALYNNFQPGTPLVTAVRIKYMPMVIDRWRWQITLVASDNQDLVDGEPNVATRDSIVAHMDELSKRVRPFILQDESGIQYEVKLMTMTRQPEKIEYLPETVTMDVNYVYSMSLEQVIAEEYQSV